LRQAGGTGRRPAHVAGASQSAHGSSSSRPCGTLLLSYNVLRLPCRFIALVDLSVTLGRLRLPNPILVASGTFGYAREMQGLVNLSRLGGILPKTITKEPRAGNAPWRTIETPAGMLNSIGLDNDGIESFLEKLMPYLADLGVPIVVSVAGRTADEFVELTARLDDVAGVAAVELNISCPNVSGGVDFGTDPGMCENLVARCRQATRLP